ncbi:TolC family protein [Aliifodinibius sp. S!AR15-10]|uniref:TolC family protein n=1 Tax=Aliifodinibius sp. S!AR15-10 TaxID=2950437 RepID=UPI002858D63F|nr:TolC family protein [Aliifodinibius sp. S!AR15-10]MDR8393994.1 TolC family protein [Aliifodinibius sp. S!AR15-10]
MNQIKITIPLVLVWLGIAGGLQSVAQAQSVLEQYIEQGIENNLSLINESLDLDLSHSKLQEVKGRFLPDISLQANYSYSDGGRTIDIPVGDLFNPIHRELNALTGESRYPTDLANVSEQLLPDDYHETKLRLIQPLFNTDIYYGYRAQKHLVSQQEARRQAVHDELVKEIKVGYYNYLKTEELVAIHESTIDLLKEMLRVNRRLVENGKATKDAIFTAEYELREAESELSEAQKQRASAKAYFNFLLNRELSVPIEQDSTVSIDSGKFNELSQLQKQALDLRPEFTQINQGISAQENMLKLNQGNALPELFVAADAGFQGYQYKFNDNQDFWFVQFGLRWNLFEGFQNRERIQQSRIEIRQLENRYQELEQQIQLRVIDSWHAWDAARKTLEAKQSGRRAAESSFRIVKRKYQENQVLWVEYIEAQNNFTNARLQQVIARYDLLARQAELERAACWTNSSSN